ncbi:hypothetical protein PFICI_01048 [Pestalotiopsis fici W106-1]|uniref:WSC domain-containing protein n=1 Tax=Pestalotiopsis fici (strain W106-1 / CGMCC3.15140) TaxID=1229662 RepID=W3XMR4_PESFW|nr:uncharacterized protein PFICI_01048 [Pestalotiopsis fici W106-1]ETS87220.1 hypothetical protein PFICI_01048 [Pestalotiopsis fici W106-1]
MESQEVKSFNAIFDEDNVEPGTAEFASLAVFDPNTGAVIGSETFVIQYVGCYGLPAGLSPFVGDNATDKYRNDTTAGDTASNCASYCASSGESLSSNNQGVCFCGETVAPGYPGDDRTNCQEECPGDKSQRCGGGQTSKRDGFSYFNVILALRQSEVEVVEVGQNSSTSIASPTGTESVTNTAASSGINTGTGSESSSNTAAASGTNTGSGSLSNTATSGANPSTVTGSFSNTTASSGSSTGTGSESSSNTAISSGINTGTITGSDTGPGASTASTASGEQSPGASASGSSFESMESLSASGSTGASDSNASSTGSGVSGSGVTNTGPTSGSLTTGSSGPTSSNDFNTGTSPGGSIPETTSPTNNQSVTPGATISSSSSAPTVTDRSDPVILAVMPTSESDGMSGNALQARGFRRQAGTTAGFVGGAGPVNPLSCTDATPFVLRNGEFFSGSQRISTNPNAAYAPFKVEQQGSISLLFSIVADTYLTWTNDAFSGGSATFCQDQYGQVYALFVSQSAIPFQCTPVVLLVYSALQCRDGTLITQAPAISTPPVTIDTTGTGGNIQTTAVPSLPDDFYPQGTIPSDGSCTMTNMTWVLGAPTFMGLA